MTTISREEFDALWKRLRDASVEPAFSPEVVAYANEQERLRDMAKTKGKGKGGKGGKGC